MEFLLKHNALVNIWNNDGWNAIVGAFANGNTEIVEKLLNAGARFQEKFAQAALMNAYMKGNREITKKLIDEGVSPNFEDSKEDPILICALKKRWLWVCKDFSW